MVNLFSISELSKQYKLFQSGQVRFRLGLGQVQVKVKVRLRLGLIQAHNLYLHCCTVKGISWPSIFCALYLLEKLSKPRFFPSLCDNVYISGVDLGQGQVSLGYVMFGKVGLGQVVQVRFDLGQGQVSLGLVNQVQVR